MTLDSAYQDVIDAHTAKWPTFNGSRDPSVGPSPDAVAFTAKVDMPDGEMAVNAPTAELALSALANDITGIPDEELKLDIQYAGLSVSRDKSQLLADQDAWGMENINAGRDPNDGGPGNDRPTQPEHPQGGPPGQRP